ncbi:hypothetical protein JW935_02765 [candidate division KSB1 bacterium]|nr:hypothetical protein [candidate division KSB1 bacterium]
MVLKNTDQIGPLKNKRSSCCYRSVFFVLFVLKISDLWAVGEILNVGGRQVALAGACSALTTGPEQIFYNPGFVFSKRKMDVTFYYAHLYGTEIVHQAAAGIASLNKFCGGVGIQTLGHSKYSEKNLVVAGCASLHDKIYLGFGLDWLMVEIENYGRDAVPIVDAGFTVRLSDQLLWGGFVKNINHATIGQTKESITQTISAGFALEFLSNIAVSVDVVKDDYSLPDIRSGFEYGIFKTLVIRCGTGNRPGRFCAGFGLSLYSIYMDYGFQSHSDLGHTHFFSLGFNFFH